MHTRMPVLERSLAIGRVIPTMAPLLAEYAACPIWPSKAATLAVLTMTPEEAGREEVEERRGRDEGGGGGGGGGKR